MMRQRYDDVPLFPVRCFNFKASDALIEDTLEKVKKLDKKQASKIKGGNLRKKSKDEADIE